MNLKLAIFPTFFSLFTVLTTTEAIAEQPQIRKPNVIMIMVDAFGYETLGCNGSADYHTPVLDAMAQNGMRFEHCYAQPLCTPSRVKLMTGISNVRNYVDFGALERSQQTFAHLLKTAGYQTCVAGKWQLGFEPDSAHHFGFDQSCLWYQITTGRDEQGHDGRYANPILCYNGELKEYTNGEFGPDLTSDFICSFMEQNRENPFFVYYPMTLTHCPFVATPDSADWQEQRKRSPTYKGDAKYFGDMVAYVDTIVGKLNAKLKQLGLTNNTVIFFTGDNGTDKPIVTKMRDGSSIAGSKGSMKDGGTRVPLIAYAPGIISKGVVSHELIDLSDFLPTICDFAGVKTPPKIDGHSFYPLLTGQDYTPRKWIYLWYSRDGSINKAQEFARNQRYKLYRTGEFFDIKKDVLERKTLPDHLLTEQARAAKIMLQAALDQYTEARPENLRKLSKQKPVRKKRQ